MAVGKHHKRRIEWRIGGFACTRDEEENVENLNNCQHLEKMETRSLHHHYITNRTFQTGVLRFNAITLQ